MRVLDKILYKAKLQVGGKVIKTDKGYVENPDGILNSATIDDNKYTGIDKAKIISDKFNGQDVSTYRYKDVDYLLDYKPKGLNNIDYGISDKTYTKSVTPVSTTNTNSASTTISERSNPKFMPNDHFSTDMSKSTNTPPVLSTSTKPNGLNRGLFTTTEKADKLGIKPKPAPIIPSVIGNTTSQQSTSNTAVQPASITTTEPQKGRGLFNRIFGRKDNKFTSDNPTSSTDIKSSTTSANNTSSSEPTLPAKYSETTTSTTTTPTLATSSNNSVSTATTSAFDPNKVSNYKLDDMGAILDENGNKIPFSSFQEENAAKELFWSTNKNVKEIPNTSNPVVTTTESSNQNPTQQATTNNAVVTEDGYSINEDGILLRYGKPTDLSPEKNDEARKKVIAKQNESSLQPNQNTSIPSKTIPQTTNSSIPAPEQQISSLPVLGNTNDKAVTTPNKEEEYRYNSHLPLGENTFEGKKYKYNGKTGNIIKSDGTVIQVDPRVKKRLDMVFNMPYTDGHAAFSLEEQELALNEAGDANGVYKEGNFVPEKDYGKNETTNNPTPVPGLTLPPNISAATSSQTESRLPVIDTKAPIKSKPIYSAQQPANVQPGVSTQSSQNINTSSVPNNNAESNKTQTQEINYFEEGKLTRDKPYYSVSKYADEALNISNITDRPLNMPLTNKVDKNGNAIPEYGKTLYPVIETKDGELKYSKGDHDNWNVPGYDNWTEDDAVKDENGNWVYKTIPAELQRKGEYLPPIDPDGMNKLRKSSLYSSLFDINGVKGKDIRRREEFITKKLKEGSPLSTEDKIYLRLTRPNINLFSEYDVKTGTLIPPYKLTEKDLKRYDRGKYIPEVVERYTQEYDKEKRNMTDVKKAEHAREKERGIYNNQYARMDALHAEVNIDREEKAEFNTMNANQRQKKIEEMEEIERAYKNMKPAPNAKILTPATEESPAIYSAYVPTKVVGNIIKNKIYTPEEISAGQMYYWEKRKGYLYLKEHYKPKNKNQTGGYINKTKYRFI